VFRNGDAGHADDRLDRDGGRPGANFLGHEHDDGASLQDDLREVPRRHVCITCVSGDPACTDMIEACCASMTSMIKAGCSCCIMMNNMPICCG
jgi:hypothetical protein